jgi:lysine-specific demethylase/histidyl-hydroxylase NO66
MWTSLLGETSVRIMLSFADLLHPFPVDRFMAEHLGRKPLYLPAGGDAGRRILDWTEFNGLLSQTSSWTAENLKLVMNSDPIPVDQYCSLVQSQSGPSMRPQPARVQVLLSAGASLVANDVQWRSKALSETTEMLGRTFAAAVGANAYCSFGGVKAFASHYDAHDVFAIHLEGEKTWRLYTNQEDNPVSMPEGDPRPYFEARRGALMQEVRMKPGDLLYLPRGWYHDALADGDRNAASLHVSFSVSPLHGRILFTLLERAAMKDPAFRAYFPPAEQDDGRPMAAQLADLGQRLSALASHPALLAELAHMQHGLTPRPADYALPSRRPLTLYQRTAAPAPAFTGQEALAMHWMFDQPRFALEDLLAQFDTVPVETLRAGVARAEQAGAIRRL